MVVLAILAAAWLVGAAFAWALCRAAALGDKVEIAGDCVRCRTRRLDCERRWR